MDDDESGGTEGKLGLTVLLLSVLFQLDDDLDLELKLGADKESFSRQPGGNCLGFLVAITASVSGLGRLLTVLESTSAVGREGGAEISANASCMAFRRSGCFGGCCWGVGGQYISCDDAEPSEKSRLRVRNPDWAVLLIVGHGEGEILVVESVTPRDVNVIASFSRLGHNQIIE